MDKTQEEKKHWKSLDEWRGSEEYKEIVHKEFMSSPLSEESQSGWARRDFLKIMGASLALGSFGCVRRPVEKIVPYVKRPEGMIPGVSNYYASSFNQEGQVMGLVVRTREGRPVKLEGNEFYPETGEALSVRGQAHLLSLYDPSRLKGPVQNLVNKTKTNKDTIETTWEKVEKDLSDQVQKGGVYVLSASNPSETSRKVIGDFVKKFGGKYLEWSPFAYDKFKKSFKALGSEVKDLPRYRLEETDFVLSLGTDFLGTGYASLQMEKAWGKRREPSKAAPIKVVQVEDVMSLTGSNADDRVVLSSQDYQAFLYAVISNLGSSSSYAKSAASDASVKSLSAHDLERAQAVAAELRKSKGRSLVLTYGVDPQLEDAEEIYKAGHFINSYLGNDGKTIDYSQAPYVSYRASSESIDELLQDIEVGKVKTLFIHDTNPMYSYVDPERFRKALSKVKIVIYTGDKNDETGSVSNYVLPDHHSLEKWNEFEGLKSVYSVVQPTISPLYKTKAFEDLLFALQASQETWVDRLKKTWKTRYSSNQAKSGFSNFEEFWVELLQKGVWDLSRFKNSSKASRTFSGRYQESSRQPASHGGAHGSDGHSSKSSKLTLRVLPSLVMGEGKYSNVGWLQELPHPVTKIVWDNYFSVSVDYAQEHHLKEGDVIEVETEKGLKLKLPVHIQPGQEAQTLSVEVGYGRKGAGELCEGIGQNAYPLLGAKVKKVKKSSLKHQLANTQGHHSMEGRAIVNEASYKEYQKDPSAGIHRHKLISLWSKHKYTGHKWAMSVDLSKCTGCSACVVACQSENNIPVVGKKHVLNGREMHWIRIDRYYSGSPKAPRTVHQPVMCQHCDNAPCETVCPVLATVHSSEGLNDMAYNRCVGTRYCSNNCPYKVRRFNWFNYSKVESPLNMALNPNVTVRSRGVMEKCTFCVQRINEGKSKASLEGRKPQDGEIRPACETTCATNAITFGDMNDEKSKVSQKFKDKRTYMLLEELNVLPSVRYMTKIYNTDQALAAAHGAGHGGGHKEEGEHHGDESHSKPDHHSEPKEHKSDSHHQEGEAHS